MNRRMEVNDLASCGRYELGAAMDMPESKRRTAAVERAMLHVHEDLTAILGTVTREDGWHEGGLWGRQDGGEVLQSPRGKTDQQLVSSAECQRAISAVVEVLRSRGRGPQGIGSNFEGLIWDEAADLIEELFAGEE